MKKLSIVILIVVLSMLAAPVDASVAATARTKGKPVAELCELNSEQSQCTVPLVAGQNTPVGEVIVDLAGDPVVTFVINDPNWFITETHVYLGDEPPAKSAPA